MRPKSINWVIYYRSEHIIQATSLAVCWFRTFKQRWKKSVCVQPEVSEVIFFPLPIWCFDSLKHSTSNTSSQAVFGKFSGPSLIQHPAPQCQLLHIRLYRLSSSSPLISETRHVRSLWQDTSRQTLLRSISDSNKTAHNYACCYLTAFGQQWKCIGNLLPSSPQPETNSRP